MSQIAKDFLVRCFASEETIGLLLRGAGKAKPQQRIVKLEQALTAQYLGWLAHMNRGGANVYVAANPLRSGSHKRTKESIASVRHLYIDIDCDGDARLAALRAADGVPRPTAILYTSPGKYQVLWRVEGFDYARQEQALKSLALTFGGDTACTDCNRVLRLPGFLNQKYSPAYQVIVEYLSDGVSEPSDFRLPDLDTHSSLPSIAVARRTAAIKDSKSEQDWAWACLELARGTDAQKLTQILAERRPDKPNPVYYAQRTIDVASARQWLLEGAPTNDVVTMLETRRRFTLPTALCSARAREIVATAQRMIDRRKLA